MTRPRRLLIVSFDLVRAHDPPLSYSVASLLAYLGASPLAAAGGLTTALEVVDLLATPHPDPDELVGRLARHDLARLDVIALAVYAWSERLVLQLVPALRTAGYRGAIALGGYQITATPDEDLAATYPGADHFLKGYAEASLLRVAAGEPGCPAILAERPDFARLPSIYLGGTIPLPEHGAVRMLRWETKRGCAYRCGFCEWRNAANKQVFEFSPERLREELDLFRARRIEKVNVLDATFNTGSRYLDIARAMVELPIQFSVQARFEQLAGARGDEFLELCQGGRIHLEFGLQTVVPEEARTIGRRNDLAAAGRAFGRLAARGVSYEVSLIFGIPGQTRESFLESVNYLLRNGCTQIRCFPLRIPRASLLERQRGADCVTERPLESNYSVEQVVESFSFGEPEWAEMAEVARVLQSKRPGSFLLCRQTGLSWEPFASCDALEVRASGEEAGPTRPGPSGLLRVEELAPWLADGAELETVCRLDGRSRRATLRQSGGDVLVYLVGRG